MPSFCPVKSGDKHIEGPVKYPEEKALVASVLSPEGLIRIFREGRGEDAYHHEEYEKAVRKAQVLSDICRQKFTEECFYASSVIFCKVCEPVYERDYQRCPGHDRTAHPEKVELVVHDVKVHIMDEQRKGYEKEHHIYGRKLRYGIFQIFICCHQYTVFSSIMSLCSSQLSS